MVCCIASGCTNESSRTKGLHFFSFPKVEKMQKVWTDKLRKENYVWKSTHRVCSAHFVESDYERSPVAMASLGYKYKVQPRLKDSAVPSVFSYKNGMGSTVNMGAVTKRQTEQMCPIPRGLSETKLESASHALKMNITPGYSTVTPTQSLTSTCVNYKPPMPMNTDISYVTKPSNGQSPVIMITPLDEDSLMHNTDLRLSEQTDANHFHEYSTGKKAKLHYENWIYPVPRGLTETAPDSAIHVTKLVPNMHAIRGNTSNTPSQTLALQYVNYKLPFPSNSQLSYATTPSQSPVLQLTPLNIVPVRQTDSSSIKDSLMHSTLSGSKRLPEETVAKDLYDSSAGKKTKLQHGNEAHFGINHLVKGYMAIQNFTSGPVDAPHCTSCTCHKKQHQKSVQTATKKTHNIGTFYHRKDCTRIKQTQTDKDNIDIITSSSTSTRSVGTDPIWRSVIQSTPTFIKANSTPAKSVRLITSNNPDKSTSNMSVNVIDSLNSLGPNYFQEESMTFDLSHTLDKISYLRQVDSIVDDQSNMGEKTTIQVKAEATDETSSSLEKSGDKLLINNKLMWKL